MHVHVVFGCRMYGGSVARYLEYGEFDGNYYGTKYDSVRQIIRSEKMCILDLNPQVESHSKS